jgi:hypothetical protein
MADWSYIVHGVALIYISLYVCNSGDHVVELGVSKNGKASK